jgi:hypothetical protein
MKCPLLYRSWAIVILGAAGFCHHDRMPLLFRSIHSAPSPARNDGRAALYRDKQYQNPVPAAVKKLEINILRPV